VSILARYPRRSYIEVAEHAQFSPLALNGPRVSEATGADIEVLWTERGHRILAITRKGRQEGRHPARTARAIELAIGEHRDKPPAPVWL